MAQIGRQALACSAHSNRLRKCELLSHSYSNRSFNEVVRLTPTHYWRGGELCGFNCRPPFTIYYDSVPFVTELVEHCACATVYACLRKGNGPFDERKVCSDW